MAAPLDERLDAWVGAGIIDAATAERIREFEERGSKAEPSAQEHASEAADRPGVLEALTYLGIIVVGIGALVLIAQNWDQLEQWARIGSAGVPALAFLLIGFALVATDDRGLRRGGQLALLAALVLVVATFAITLDEAGYLDDSDGRGSFLLLSLVGLAVAAALWAFVPSTPQLVGVAGSAFMVCQAIGAWPDDFSTELVGVSSLLIAGVAIGLVEVRRLAPVASGRALFAVLMVAGAYEAYFDSPFVFELQVFAVGVVLIALAILRGSFTYMVFGVGAVFLGLITFMFDHFSDELGAPLALILTGALTLAGVVILAQSRRLYRRRRVAA